MPVIVDRLEFEEVQRSIKNILSAIEQGIFTGATKERLLEPEDWQRELEITIAVAKESLVEIPRSRIEYIITAFRTGDLDSKEYQDKLIDNFVRAVYLYDDNIRIVFNFTKEQRTVDIPFEDVDGFSDASPECSFKVSEGPPKQKAAKRLQRLLFCFGLRVVFPHPIRGRSPPPLHLYEVKL